MFLERLSTISSVVFSLSIIDPRGRVLIVNNTFSYRSGHDYYVKEITWSLNRNTAVGADKKGKTLKNPIVLYFVCFLFFAHRVPSIIFALSFPLFRP